MAFLDNSGDILLDAVLTDTGRMRMARGDFKIVKFALGDDEINYGLFEANHASGSAYQDLKILQTPVFEAFTNNTSVMKSKLMTIGRTNILYLPKLLLNTLQTPFSTTANNTGTFIVVANSTLVQALGTSGRERDGYIYGDGRADYPKNGIIIDQGIVDENDDLDITSAIDPDLRETQFIVKIDHRILRISRTNMDPKTLGKVVTGVSDPADNSTRVPIFIDDDQIAHYNFGSADTDYVRALIPATGDDNNVDQFKAAVKHRGPLGNRFAFSLQASPAARSSTALYSKLGTTGTLQIDKKGSGNVGSCDFIDTIARVSGVTTGYSIDIPIRVVRNATAT